MAKTADFALVDPSKLVSRKIWMTEKSWNGHTVQKNSRISTHREIINLPIQKFDARPHEFGGKVRSLFGSGFLNIGSAAHEIGQCKK